MITASERIIRTSLQLLQEAGNENRERVLLWLAARDPHELIVREVFQPQQESESDYFWITRESMLQLHTYLRNRSLMVAAQVHSHPFKAFHSAADDKWAIIRHVGALSIVLPYFALRTAVKDFENDAAVYYLSHSNLWTKMPRHERHNYCRIVL